MNLPSLLKRGAWGLILLMIVGLLSACAPQTPAGTDPDDTEPIETSVGIGTQPTGSTFHAVGTGIAKIVTEFSPVSMTVRPMGGSSGWMPLLAREDLETGICSWMEARWALTGEAQAGYPIPTPNIRALSQGCPSDDSGLIVLAESDIYTGADLKGKRVGYGYGGSYAAHALAEAFLASVGLTWDDVVAVPVSSNVAGIEALRDRHVDAVYGLGIAVPIVMEVHAATPVRCLHWGDLTVEEVEQQGVSKELDELINSFVPGLSIVVHKGGVGYLDNDIVGCTYDMLLVCAASLSEDAGYEIIKALYENTDELAPIHRALKLWTQDVMFSPDPLVPYHPGAVKFFKEQGLWNDEVEAKQKALLAEAAEIEASLQ